MIKRIMAETILKLAKKYPVIALTGPRQSGKSTLTRHLFPNHQYVNLESPQVRDFAENDPESFFKKYSGNVILDEVQNVPSLFPYIQVIVDEKKVMGDFVITGSSQFKLSEQITQSLAGRVSLFKLLPLSLTELEQGGLYTHFYEHTHKGFYPAIYDRSIEAQDYYADYTQTYVERDVRSLVNVKDLKIFQTFLKLCAGRVGSIVNFTSLGNDVGVSRETIKTWLNILEASYVAFQLPPYFNNIGKRLVKSPKLYFYDVGLLCYLLGITSLENLETHPLRGGIFENLIISDLMKSYFNKHKVPEFYFYQDNKGDEVDLVFLKEGQPIGVEIKSAQSFSDSFLSNLKKWQRLTGTDPGQGFVVYAGELSQVREGFRILTPENLDMLQPKS